MLTAMQLRSAVHLSAANLDEAIAVSREIVREAEACGDKRVAEWALLNTGDLLLEKEDFDAAGEVLSQLGSRYNEGLPTAFQALALGRLLYLSEEDPWLALRMYRIARAVAETGQGRDRFGGGSGQASWRWRRWRERGRMVTPLPP